MGLIRGFFRLLGRLLPGSRSRDNWDGYDAIDHTNVDDSDDWRDRNNNHI